MMENQPCRTALKCQGPSSDSQSDSVSQARPGKLFTIHRPTRPEHILSILYFTINVKGERWKVEGGRWKVEAIAFVVPTHLFHFRIPAF